MFSPTLRPTTVSKTTLAICFAIIFFLLVAPAVCGQQPGVLVATRNSNLSVFDLGLQNLLQSEAGGYATWSVAVDPNNPRLAYVGAGTYISVFDLTIGREINRIYGVAGEGYLAFTPDGKYLLLADVSNYSLDIIDVARQTLVRKVSLTRAMSTGATQGVLGSIVVVGTKAYVTTGITDTSRPAIAVVNLRTFQVRPIRLPADGSFDGYGYNSPNAAVTPDQKYVVMAQDNNIDGSEHLFFISTATDQVVHDVQPSWAQNWGINGLVISPVANYGYLLGYGQAVVIDLNNGSPTFGQQLPGTTPVDFSSWFSQPTAAAITADGAKLVVSGFKAWTTSPNPNVIELDTSLMVTNPNAALVAQAIAHGGNRPYGVAVGTITTTPPSTAPTVTSVSGPITNDIPNTVTITGTNFAPGAMVRIGTMPLLPATLSTSSSLQVTLPQNAAARATQDVVVINPGTSGPRSLQYQSGLLPGALTIKPNPAYQPQNQFAAYRAGAHAVSVFDPVSGTMLDNATGPEPFGIAFNLDGASIYGPSFGPQGSVSKPQATIWDPVNASVKTQVLLPLTNTVGFTFLLGPNAIAASINPTTGGPVVFVPARNRTAGKYDLRLEIVDTDSTSGTFNTVISNFAAGLNSSQTVYTYGCAATPDGKFVYVIYSTIFGTPTDLAIFDVLKGTASTVPLASLGVKYSSFMQVTPDGRSLLINASDQNPNAGPIAALDISQQPKNPVLITTIKGIPPPHVGGTGPFNFSSFQVVGKRLFALGDGQVVVFNFDRSTFDFSQVTMYPQKGDWLTVSPDGALAYVTDIDKDMISVLDTNKLATGQPPLITNIGTLPAVFYAVFNPVPIASGSLQVTTTSLPSGTQGVAYSASLAVSGGVPPYKWAVTSGSLPSGLSLSQSGAITGIPSGSPTTSNLTVQVTDLLKHTATSGSLSITVQQGTPLQVTTTTLPAGPVNQPYYAALAATGGVPPYSWTVTAGGSSLSALGLGVATAGTIAGTPATTGTAQFTVQVRDSAMIPSQQSAQLSISINGGGNTAALNGHYAIQLSGFSPSTGQFAATFGIVADGAGNINNGGMVDFNSVNGPPLSTTVTGGTYLVDSTGLGQMTLTLQGGNTVTFAFSLSSTGSGRIIEYDDTTGNGSRGAGVIRLQHPTAFSLSSISGTYVLGIAGADKLGNRGALVGELAADGAGNLSSGLGDVNDNGMVENFTFAGKLSTIDPNSGRATIQITDNFSEILNFAVYVVSASEALMITIDPVQGGGHALLSGSVLRQTGAGSFNNASLQGTSILQQQIGHSGLNPWETEVGFLYTDGAGNFSGQTDKSSGSGIKQNSFSGHYQVASNGRATTGAGNPILYLIGPNQAVLLGQDQSVPFGSFEPQAPGPYSNASTAGTYSGGNLAPLELEVQNTVATVSADGSGNGVGNDFTSGPSGLSQSTGSAITLNIAPNGRGASPDGSIIYMVSPTKIVVLPTSFDPDIEIYEH